MLIYWYQHPPLCHKCVVGDAFRTSVTCLPTVTSLLCGFLSGGLVSLPRISWTCMSRCRLEKLCGSHLNQNHKLSDRNVQLQDGDALQLGQGLEEEGGPGNGHHILKLRSRRSKLQHLTSQSQLLATQMHVTFHITRVRTDAGLSVAFCFSTLLNRYG